MKVSNMHNEKIIQVVDLLEQIQSINEMIEVHRKDSDNFMLNQYSFRKEKIVKALGVILSEFNITPEDLAA